MPTSKITLKQKKMQFYGDEHPLLRHSDALKLIHAVFELVTLSLLSPSAKRFGGRGLQSVPARRACRLGTKRRVK